MTKLKQGHYYSRISYGRVLHAGQNGFQLRNDKGYSWTVQKDVIDNENVCSSDYVEKEEKLTKTDLARLFVQDTGSRVFTVSFNTQDGTERILRGHINKVDIYLGKSLVIDLELENDPEKDYDTRLRWVYHDQLNWIILDGIKYIKK